MRAEEFGLITDQEVYEAICTGEVIETYPDDTPYPSVLIFGMTDADRPLHVVCAYDGEDDQAVIITVYNPYPTRWEDYRRNRPCAFRPPRTMKTDHGRDARAVPHFQGSSTCRS
ncbi:MAG: DUF4258 domain-containing protein [Acidobacteria bacterium]|nr:DUF4258 domain-containing protein [Acidobacteriota bacterium]